MERAYVTRAYALPQELVEWCEEQGLRPLPPAHVLQLTDGRWVASDIYGGGALEGLEFQSLDDIGMFLAGWTGLDDWELIVDLAEEDPHHPSIGDEWRAGEQDEDDDGEPSAPTGEPEWVQINNDYDEDEDDQWLTN